MIHPKLRNLLAAGLIAAGVALTGCGGGEQEAAQAPATVTVTAEAPPATVDEPAPKPAETEAETRTTTEADASAEDSGQDPIEAQQEYFMALDDEAIALDKILARGIDGRDVARPIKRLRARVTDLVYDRAVEGDEHSQAVTDLQGVVASSENAARAGDIRELISLRRELAEARAAVAGDLIGP